MLPPSLAALTFADAALGADDALAGRTAAAVPGGRVLVLGALRTGLSRALLERGCEVVVVDSSRTSLHRARAVLGHDAVLLAADPRELEVPGGADAALLPSATWRAVVLEQDRRLVLRSVSRELRPHGLLLLELERLSGEIPDTATALAGAADGTTWWRDAAAGDAAWVRSGDAAAPDVALFGTFTPEQAVAEALAEGFAAAELTDAATGARAHAATTSVWARLRTTRGAR